MEVDNMSNIKFKIEKEDLLQLLQEFYKENNRLPKREEIGEGKVIPSQKVCIRVCKVKTWTEVLKMADVPSGKTMVNYSKEDLIVLLQNYYIKNGKSPTINDLGRKRNMPSSEYFYVRFRTQSWNEILKEAQVPLNHFEGYTKEFAIEKLKEYYKYLGKIPTREDFKKYSFTPSHIFYNREFGSYENACYIAGLIDKPLTDIERIAISIDNLMLLAKQLNRCPTVYEFESFKHRGFSRRILEDKLNLKYNNICRKYIPDYKLNNNRDYTKEEIADKLKFIYEQLNRAPMFYELKEYNFHHDIGLMSKLFDVDTYNEVMLAMGWTPSGTTTIVKPKDEMLKDFYSYFLELGRVPYSYEINNNKNMCTHPTYLIHFESIENVCNLLNIDYKKHYIPNLYQVYFDKIGEPCRSRGEVTITNWLIDNNIKYTKEFPYKHVTFDIDHRRFDWMVEINSIQYYIEFAGLYGSGLFNYDEKTERKIKDLISLGVYDRCLFIYPKDIPHDFKSKITTLLHIQ
jgi:hypothetical protein